MKNVKKMHKEHKGIEAVKHVAKQHPESTALTNVIISLAVILALVLGYNIYQTSTIGQAPKVDMPDLELTMIVDPDCTDCSDISPLEDFLKQFGDVDADTIKPDSFEGKRLIKKYGIERLPSAIVTGELDKAAELKSQWEQFGTVTDDALVLSNTPPPFLNLTSGEVQGLVEITFLADESCTGCYDPQLHKQALVSFGLTKFSKETIVDISSAEGKALLKKYNIKAAPTVILSSGASEYPGLSQIWKNVGTIESDGSYVFRTMTAIKGAAYRDLVSGEIVGATSSTT